MGRQMRYKLRISPPYKDAGRVTPSGGASAVPAGVGSSPAHSGGLGKTRAVRHHDRSAGAISLDWDSKARVTPAVTLVEASVRP
jgi:hypothetical protein